MLIRNVKNCAEFTSADGCRLHEFLHPDRQDVAIRYSLARAELGPGRRSHPHALRTAEVYCILEGTGVMHIDEEESAVGPGDAVYIPPGSVQSIANDGTIPLVFLCIVDPAWRAEDERVL